MQKPQQERDGSTQAPAPVLDDWPHPLQAHPQNTGFAWPAYRPATLSALTETQWQTYQDVGAVTLKGFLPADALAQLRAAVDEQEARAPDAALTMADGYRIDYKADTFSFARNLAGKSPQIAAFALGARIKALMTDLIGPDVRLYWDQAVYKKPGEPREFPFHQDNGYTFVAPQAYVTCWLALNDATTENGCPWIIPQVHRYGTFVHNNAPYGLEVKDIDALKPRAITCPAAAGDMVVFSSLTPHMTGPNTTHTVRKALITQYIPDGARGVGPDGTAFVLNDPNAQPALT